MLSIFTYLLCALSILKYVLHTITTCNFDTEVLYMFINTSILNQLLDILKVSA